MTTRHVKHAIGDWRRHHPTDRRIAAALLQHPALLGLRTRRLAPDVVARFGVANSTARNAIAIARKYA